ncbi:MFS transporter [Streptomyces iranensis]|uniref:Putative proline/betaine transporter n=1 Tax=Streptomyces iranensis TaxID=576784 RepID=A0A061A653_9ACTN|nr:MFS transporter [Streptomyces iranensis]MBP2066171.1 MHS family proline/betaine transporter-like MFS transporter [Streptomyces iranensis]CDR13131.1 major facilitator superfamily MFS_1 [Streptomyces iranensis]
MPPVQQPDVTASSTDVPSTRQKAMRQVTLAGGVGTAIEYYDFSVYGFLALTIADVFFPQSDPAAALLYTLAVFGAAFALRPIGGVLLGHVADRYGRRPALATAVLGMAFASTAMGVLPSFAAIGVAAPVMLLILRCVQGISAGGELGSAAAFVAEAAPDRTRGFHTSTTQIGTLAGTLLGALVVAIVRWGLTPEQLSAWGWRIPFLLSLPLGILALVVRRRVEESKDFANLEEAGRVAKVPALAALRSHTRGVLTVCGLSLVSFAAYYIVFSYMTTYFTAQKIMSPDAAVWTSVLTLALATIAIPLWGTACDRWGRRPILIGVSAANLVLSYPLFLLMGQGSVTWAVVAQIVLGQAEAAYMGVILAAYTELFPAKVRASGFSLGYNAASIITGGSAPYIATWLIEETSNKLAPAWMLMTAAAISLGTALTLKETARRPLPTV